MKTAAVSGFWTKDARDLQIVAKHKRRRKTFM
jgi:hypothetical protein